MAKAVGVQGHPIIRRGARNLSPPHGALILVALAVAWNLVNLRAELLPVPYLDDSSLHEQMVRFATAQLQAGHFPLTSWFPYLGLGSPQFLHYQSLPAMLTGALGLITGPGAAFRWTLYLLLSLWPVSIYASARLFGLKRSAAGASAAMAPFIMSVVGVGYEQRAYIWTGFGVWTQLWASLTLPLAWGCSWRAIRDGGGRSAAIALVSLTAALHFETGYLAVLPILIWPWVAGRPLALTLRRAGVVLGGSLLAMAWVVVPLLAQRPWAATNEILRGTLLENGYGAGHMLGWLVRGQLLDYGRFPVLTILVGIGLVVALARWPEEPAARALLSVLAGCLVLSFGRTTFGPLADMIPGSADFYFRRFMMGVQLAALLVAGLGISAVATAAWGTLQRRGARWRSLVGASNANARSAATLLPIAFMAVALAPAWLQLHSVDNANAAAINAQRRADAIEGPDIDRLIAVAKRAGPGRVYAGLPTNWGNSFTVGAVPVFKYLESRDVDEVGYTLRTASLMTDPEYFFDEADQSGYSLFGIRYLILPRSRRPPIAAPLLVRAGPYSLWRTNDSGFVHTGRIIGTLTANRSDIGLRSVPLMQSGLAAAGAYLRITFEHHVTPPSPLPPRPAAVVRGRVLHETDNLAAGESAATIRMNEPGVVVLSASFDPGWEATVDGRPNFTQIVGPALVATSIPAGVHTVVFRYRGYGGYPVLFAISAAALLVLAVDEVRRRRRRSGGTQSLGELLAPGRFDMRGSINGRS